ncbi:RNA-directed DNA polymerase [Providencia rettgeri]|uniref:RNA-directed DNA polymerase n=1 Tax=Providencia rettgeri TaxID=587 RepID=A0AAP2JTD8_PRORE|nr:MULTISPECIES: reverse transcriptase domain-containing protein [Providencia]MBX6954522.1 RNA-directed DNA polymerase [Providencia rettgeri]MBX6959978.1 RNA-directed DNA polymerase [Providencia rettgeri]MBX6972318.1 RNA-directed DNA polymerase [Providencia rettgeri]MBX6978673.1 RNA-directed DNA polymerase [Providencia rettgeri]MBX6985857.1 RNA-directed DNA polymerase [Providencia rettgeri]
MSVQIKDIFDIYFNNSMEFNELIHLNKDDYLELKTYKGKEIIAYKKGFNKLKLLHRFLNEAVFNRIEIMNDVVFSYRKGVNVLNCVMPHRNSNFIFKTDINNFFPSFSSKFIEVKLINKFNNFIISDINQYLPEIVDIVTYNNTLPIGLSTSPSLSNILFSDIDFKIKLFSNENEYYYTRYADDIIISSNRDINKNTIFDDLQQILTSENDNFILNKSKTKLLRKGNLRKIMGVCIMPDGHITVDKKLKNNIETKLYYMSKLNNIHSKDSETTEIKRYLSGIINYVSTIDNSYINKLKRKYGSTIVEMFIRKSLIK